MRKRKPEPCDVELKVWVPRSLFDKIDRRAFAEGLKLSTTARRLLEAATAERDGRSEAA
jgi:hypothetical protein